MRDANAGLVYFLQHDDHSDPARHAKRQYQWIVARGDHERFCNLKRRWRDLTPVLRRLSRLPKTDIAIGPSADLAIGDLYRVMDIGLWMRHAGTKPRLTNSDITADDLFNFASRASSVVDQNFGAGRQLPHWRLDLKNSEQWCFLRRGRSCCRCAGGLRVKAFQTFCGIRNCFAIFWLVETLQALGGVRNHLAISRLSDGVKCKNRQAHAPQQITHDASK